MNTLHLLLSVLMTTALSAPDVDFSEKLQKVVDNLLGTEEFQVYLVLFDMPNKIISFAQ